MSCGDAISAEDVAALMDAQQANLIFTDPPYNVAFESSDGLKIKNDAIKGDVFEAFIEQLGERYDIREIAYDRWGAVQMSQNFQAAGFTVVPFSQGFRDMSPPSKELMKLALESKLAHAGYSVLAWMVDNIHIRQNPAENIKPDKQKSTEKINGVVATIMTLDHAIRGGNASSGGSVYDQRGLLML